LSTVRFHSGRNHRPSLFHNHQNQPLPFSGKKDFLIQDLEKAKWYLEREILKEIN
jgi:hypothetical protein